MPDGEMILLRRLRTATLLTFASLFPTYSPQLHSLSLLLDQCNSSICTTVLKRIHSQLISTGDIISDASLSLKLMRCYSARGEPDAARKVFDEIPVKSTIFYNVMIRSYSSNNRCKDAILVYAIMGRDCVSPDNYSLPCVLKACSSLKDLMMGMEVHCTAVKIGLDMNLFVGNCLIALYAKCGFLDRAQKVFDEMMFEDVVSWNSIIAGYAQNGKFDLAIGLCRKMVQSRKKKPNAGTMASILPAMMDTDSENVVFARRMFDEMQDKGLISWNTMIAIYVGNGMASEAIELFSKLELEGIEPDIITLASILPACADLSALTVGNRIREYVNKLGIRGNLALDNALIDMYAKCGCLQSAREVFDSMKARDVISWTSMISAYGMTGHGHDAVALFEQMQQTGVLPDHIAFVTILSACSHSGLLKEGRHYFHSMTKKYKTTPTIEHLSCMVDLLGRSGQIEEAFAMVNRMAIQPNERVWGSLLSACRVHSNMTIGLIVADELFKLVPERPTYYVLLSNIYAKAGRWEDVTSVRNIMKSRGLKKIPGCSNVEFANKVHSFLVGDTSHPQSKEIYAELDVLLGRMKEAGYNADTDSALHDVEEEEKEGHLAVHSEKLAIVFMLLNTSPGTTIRITKNLRVCGDCHSAAKFISKITEREIILRDLNRFHHFASGLCSCGDYW